jgi:F-type H+-transporting ATPase subunit delta
MDESAITVRYAKAVFSLAKENNQLSILKKDAELIAAVCRQSADFNRFLKNPVVKTSEKIRLIHLIFKEKADVLSLNFLTLMTQNKREEFIPAVCRNILSLIREEKNIKTAVLTTAVEMDEDLLQKAEKILEKELGTQVELTGRVNPHIIGGVVLQIDGKQYDDSIATQLKKLKQEFLKTEV